MQTSDGRTPFDWARDIYSNQGLKAVLKEGARFGTEELLESIFSIEPVDDYCYGKSLKRLTRLQSSETSYDDVLYNAYKFRGEGHYRTISPQQHYGEIIKATKYIDDHKISTVLEIGTDRGGTLYNWVRNLNPAHVICIDLTISQEQQRFFQHFNRQTKIDCFRANSQSMDTVRSVSKTIDGDVDFLFIDGDHTYEGVKADWENYKDVVCPGGIVAFHDIEYSEEENGWIDVPDFWNEIKGQYDTVEIRSPIEDGGGIGILHL